MLKHTAISRVIEPILVRWVDFNQEDESKYSCATQTCGKELNAKTKEALLAHELFSAMPPWVTVKCLLSFLVTDGVRRTVGHRNLRHLSCSLYAEIRQTIVHRASERSQGTVTRRRGRTIVSQHVRIQRCKQQVDAKLVESSPVRRGVCSWQGQSCQVLERHHSEHIVQGQQLLRTESLYWARVKDAILFRSSRIHDTLN